MRETSFIRQNQQKWETFEEEFEKNTDPEKVSNLFIQITDDLSYARTYYPNRSVKIYLNNLAQRVFRKIYTNRVRPRTKFKLFWTQELPNNLYESRRTLFFTFALFIVAFGIGIFSSMHDPEFARFILGSEYVDMTEQNIEDGDPMKVYKDSGEFNMFFSIALNNLWVSFLTMAFGIFFGFGTAYFILYNGIMIGAFQYFFIERGLFVDSFLTIWVHGALEVSAIVIAGAAGMTLGRGLLFPGTLTRIQSFRLNGLHAIQIYLGITPIIILAAINESFLTRYTETPDWVRLMLISVEFIFMYMYFVHIPRRRAKSGVTIKKPFDEIPHIQEPEISFTRIKTNGQIFSDSFTIIRKYFWPALSVMAILTAVYTAAYVYFVEHFDSISHTINILRTMAVFEARADIRHMLNYKHVFDFTRDQGEHILKPGAILFLMNTLAMSLITLFGLYIIKLIKDQGSAFQTRGFLMFVLKNGWKAILLFILLHSVLLLDFKLKFLFFLGLLPFCLVVIAAAILDQGLFTKHLSTAFRFIIQIELLFWPLALLTLTLSCLSHSVIAQINVTLLSWNFPFKERVYEALQDLSITYMLLLTLFMMIGMMAVNMGLLLFSNKEIDTASDLITRIDRLNQAKRPAHEK